MLLTHFCGTFIHICTFKHADVTCFTALKPVYDIKKYHYSVDVLVFSLKQNAHLIPMLVLHEQMQPNNLLQSIGGTGLFTYIYKLILFIFFVDFTISVS